MSFQQSIMGQEQAPCAGSIRYQVLPGLRRSDLPLPASTEGADLVAWWRPVKVI